MEDDPEITKNTIIALIRNLLKVNVGSEIFTYPEFQEFLRSERIYFLKIAYVPTSNQLILITNNTSKKITDKSLNLVFYKSTFMSVDLASFFNYVDVTFSQSSFATLLRREIDANILASLKQNKNLNQTAIPSYIENFKERIVSIEKKLRNDQITSGQITEENYSVICIPEEEIDFWKMYSKINPSDVRADSISQQYNKVEKYFLPSYEIIPEKCSEIFTQLLGCCEDIIQKIVPKVNVERLKHFINISFDHFANQISIKINSFKNDTSQQTLLKLIEIQKGLKFCFDRVDTLNKLYFKANPLQLAGSLIEKLMNKITEIIEIKALLSEIKKLMPEIAKEQEKVALNNDNKNNEDILKLLDSNLDKVSSDIISKLNKDVFDTGNDIIMVLRDLNQWKGILSRGKFQTLTYDKRADLLKQLSSYLSTLKQYFNNRNQSEFIDEDAEDTVQDKRIIGISQKISQIITTHTLKQKCESCIKLSSKLLNDIKEYKTFYSEANELLENVSRYIDDLISEWNSIYVNMGDALPKFGSDLVEFDKKTGFLQVNFSEKLFQLIQDCRLLTEYGYAQKIMKETAKINDEGKKILKDAISLKQIANFYNSLSSQVIPSQKPMLVKCAKEFEINLTTVTERFKKNKGSLSLETYVTFIQSAANSLTTEIRRLKKAHMNILDLLCQLLNYDLISNRHKWKEIIKKAHLIYNEVAENYKGEEYLLSEWKNHWNFQLYKILKIQYTLSLEKFYSFVTEVNCEFKIQHKALSLYPNLEEMKKQIFKEIKNFISIPSQIRNFIDDETEPSYYHTIIEENKDMIKTLYDKLNSAIGQLYKMQKNLESTIGLSFVNFDSYIEDNFSKMEDWKFNYDLLRCKRKELEKMEDVVKIDCFKVNLTSYKLFIDDTFEKIFDALGSSLRDHLLKTMKGIDLFVKDSMEKMTHKATSPQEIMEFKTNFGELTKKKFEYQKQCKECEKMNKLLILLTGQSLNLSSLEKRWNNFDVMLNGFSDMLKEQKKIIKVEQNKKIKQLLDSLDKFYSTWKATILPDNYMPDKNTDMAKISDSIKKVCDQWDNIEQQMTTILEDMKNFDLELETDISKYKNIKNEVDQTKQKWQLLFDFNAQLENMSKEEWLGIRFKAHAMIQDLISNWEIKVKKMEKNFLYFHIRSQIDFYKQSTSIYRYLIGDNFERDHWKTLFNLLKMDNKVTKETLTFGNFIEKTSRLISKQGEIKDLYQRAQGEILIRNAMSELASWFETAEFQFTENINAVTNRKTPLIKEWKELMNDISEKQALLLSVKTSEYFSRFADQIENYETKFANLDIWLADLNLIQRKWVYLEPIFSRGALPNEQSRFKKIDDEFRNILLTLNTNLKVSTIFSIIGIKNTLDMLIDQLEKCQKALNDFLEDKRNKFARLYFIGDDDLLEFLAKSKDRGVIKNNLRKLYQGITNLQISDNKITNIDSLINESVKLNKDVVIVDELEKWLNDLTNEMRKALNNQLVDAIKNYGKSNDANFGYLDSYAAQTCNILEMIKFNHNVDKAIKSNSLTKLQADTKQLIQNLTVVQAKSGSDNIKLFKIKNLMLDLIHNREVIDRLVNANVKDVIDWDWFFQLKYFIQPSNNNQVTVAMCDGNFMYTFEYQGACQKLVHTPLTDKCYLTLTSALKLGYGGNPYGPAGTGKTESVKALGQAFGRQVLVFNCDEGIDFKAMGRIFIGLVKSGAWGCFDEFNRLLEEQLSAISIQIQIIQFALKNKLEHIDLLNQKVQVDFNAAIYVTMNPACKGYGGRSKLPDNLKILFRPVAMSVPDNLQIAQTLLYAEGFKNGDILAKKVTTLFTLCKQGLSNQQHYDWGLRALKTILTVASQQIQNYLNEGKVASYEEEMQILIKAIRINVLSKLTFDDATIFNLLIRDVFPGVDMSDIVYEEVNKALMESYAALKYEYIDSQFKKVVQFYEACRQRMGVVIVGPSGCGKSAIWKLLKEAYGKMKQKIVVHIINPKSMSRKLLLGYMNHDTGEYTYGVLTKCAREVEKESTDVKCWIICDGDVDPEWIEALNSVLDDNRLLTMQNGERINFGNNVNFIFETDSLKFASPATVSRMGIIYMNQEDLDIKSLTTSWVKKNFTGELANQADIVSSWFENYFFSAYDQFKDGYNIMVSTTNFGIINNFLSLMKVTEGSTISKAAFADAIIKGLGSNLGIDERKKFAMTIYQLIGEKPPSMSNLLDVYYDSKEQKLVEFEYQKKKLDISSFSNTLNYPIVKTAPVLRDLSILSNWFESNEPFIVVGPEGCGKSLLITNAISQLRSCQITTLNCTSQTSSTNIIQKLMQSCALSNTSRGKCLRPRDCQKLIVYLKDINLPKPDKYNTIQLISFLQQIVAYQGFFDDNLEFVYLEKIQIIASMNPSSTVGRFEITTRFTGNVRILFVDYPSPSDMNVIYTDYLKCILSSENLGKLRDISQLLAKCSISVYTNVKTKFTFDNHHHYIFTPRDVSNWLIGLLRYECKNYDELITVWCYEGMRIFRDKLVGNESKKLFDQMLSNELSNIISSGKYIKNTKIDIQSINNSLIYTSLSSGKNLIQIQKDDYIDLLNKGKMIYERDNDDLHTNYFDEFIQNCKIVDRIISQTHSNILLIGSYAVGRKKCVRITSSAKNYEQFSLSLTKDYSMKEFKKNIKDVFNIVTVENRVVLFIIEMHHIIQPEFMEYINSLLCSGEVPSLLSRDEQDSFLNQLMNEFKEQNEYRTPYEFFISRIRKNLKMCILLDHDDKEFNQIILNNPALVTRCNVVWFNELSEDTLKQLIKDELQSSFTLLQKSNIINEKDTTLIQQAMIDMYKATSNRSEYDIISSHGKFIQFILTFKKIINDKMQGSSNAQSHLKSGLNKLEEAEKFVGELTEKSKTQKQEIESKQIEAKQSLSKITEAMTMSNTKKEQLNVLNAEINEKKIKIEADKAQVEEQLKDVMPEVEKAQALVKKIDSGALAEITVYFRKNLPSVVFWNLKAMLQLIGYDDLNETEIKGTFNMKTILALQNFNINNLTQENAKKVERIVTSNKKDFNESQVATTNANLAKITKFIKAALKFFDVKLSIAPLEKKLHDAQKELESIQKKVNNNLKEIATIEKNVKEYENKYAKLTGEAELLKIELNKTEELLTKARSLLGKLTGEKNRWEQQIKELQISNEMIPYNTLLASAFITFMGYYNESIRETLWDKWIRCIDFGKHQNNTVKIVNYLLNESEMLKLKFEGLPTDTLSLENALIINNSVKTVFIIDPVQKATQWFIQNIKKTSNAVDIASLHDSKLLTNIELAIRFGKNLLITDVDKIESFLVPLLRGEKFKRGPTNVIRLGEKIIDIHEKFKLYLATRDSSIEISNNVLASISVVNFTVTRSGLESILLGLTIDIEQPELEKQKNMLLEEQDKIKLELSEVEKKLLDELIHLEGNLLENKQLIDSLEQSKEKSMQSEQILKKSIEQSNEIEHKRNIYKNLSKTATTIYILLQDLYKINPMYQFSLDNYMALFKDTIKEETTKQFDSFEMKLKTYSNVLIKKAFVYYSRSLFKSDLLIFGLFYIKTIFNDSSNKKYWDFLLGQSSSMKGDGSSSSSVPRWLPEERKQIYEAFASVFPELTSIPNENWYRGSTPEEDLKRANILPLGKMVIIQVFRPDRLESAMKNFICESLNIPSLAPPSLSINQLIHDASNDNKTPIMFLTTLGSDPSKELEDFAVKEVGRENYIEVPLGAGNNSTLIDMLKDASEKGKWLVFKNIHLAISWLPTLEKEIKSLQNPNSKFRLFLTSETHSKFSPILLQSCMKYTYETPPGVKKNMERIYQTWSNDVLNSNSINATVKQALFALAFIHAILQERRTYIPQGWSKFYEFSYSDLKVSQETLCDYLSRSGDVDSLWNNIKGLIKGTFYGGRIDNDFDHIVMCTYIDSILNQRNLSTKGNHILNKLPVVCSNSVYDYLSIINSLPENDDPEMFGLPLNVDRSVQRYISTQVLLKLNSIYSMSSDMNKFDKALWTEKLSPLLNMWKSIYSQSTIDSMKSQYIKINSKDPISIYIKSEASQICELGNKVNNCLKDISDALLGNGIITQMILNNSNALLSQSIPEEWSNIWDGPEIPSEYLKALGKKINGLDKYIKSAGNDNVLDNCKVNLAEFLHPEAFINALRQKSAREMKVPIDELEISCEFDKQGASGVCAKVSGLFLQGADFDGSKLVDISGNKSEIVAMPTCYLKWGKGDKGNKGKVIDIPLYENLFREHFICKLGLQYQGELERVILKGIALCLD